MKRYPTVAGLFYESDPETLLERLRWAFLHELGPGEIPERVEKKLNKNHGLIVPHAGYIYSGPIASWAYDEISKHGKPDTVIMIGPNHTGFGEDVGIWSSGFWETPLGELEVDEELTRMILELGEGTVKEDIESHTNEHSLEVQLPFLQFIYGDDFRIVPITMMDQRLKTAEGLAETLRKVAENTDKKILFIASTDLNHYENHEETVKKDEILINRILDSDVRGMYEVIREYYITICGYGPVAVLLMLNLGNPKLLKHATSGEMSGDYSKVVGYASFIVSG